MTYQNLVEQYGALLEQQALLTERLGKLKADIIAALQEEGTADDKGSLKLLVDSENTDISEVVYQRRVSKALDMDAAEEVLFVKNLMERCISMQPVLDEQEIMAAYAEDLLDDQDIDTMFPSKETWAFVVKKKK